MADVLYVTLEVTLKEGADPDKVKDSLPRYHIPVFFNNDSVESTIIVDVELGT